jgi:hypothetical protein
MFIHMEFFLMMQKTQAMNKPINTISCGPCYVVIVAITRKSGCHPPSLLGHRHRQR